MTIRKNIIDELETGLKTIIQSNGYRTDIGNTVYTWKEIPINQDETQSLIIKDPINRNESPGYFNHEQVIEINVEIFYSGTDPVSLVRDTIADVYEWCGKNQQLNGNSERIEYVSDTIESEHLEQITAAGLLRLDVYYITNAFKPDVIGYTR
jgi:hypothetical protein